VTEFSDIPRIINFFNETKKEKKTHWDRHPMHRFTNCADDELKIFHFVFNFKVQVFRFFSFPECQIELSSKSLEMLMLDKRVEYFNGSEMLRNNQARLV
jgi:hypothetical protein